MNTKEFEKKIDEKCGIKGNAQSFLGITKCTLEIINEEAEGDIVIEAVIKIIKNLNITSKGEIVTIEK